MPREPVRPKWAKLDFPPEFQLGLEGLAEVAKWRIRRTPDGAEVATEERYENRFPNLLRLTRLADKKNASDPAAYAPFRSWQPQDGLRSEDVASRVQGLQEVADPASATDVWVSFRLQFLTIPDAAVGPFVRETFEWVVKELPSASLWVIEFDEALAWRIAAVRMLFAAQHNPDVLRRATDPGVRVTTPIALIRALGYGLDPFIAPLVLPASPWVIGVNGVRRGGHVLILFGRAAAGFSDKQAADLLDLLQPQGPVRSPTTVPAVTPESSESWVRWWVHHLNVLLGQALDVGSFSDAEGRYQPSIHLGVLSSVERLFSSVQWILAHSTRGEGRLWRLFDVVDLLDGLSFGSWEQMLRPDRLVRQLERLEASLPLPARSLALARCLPALHALDEFSRSFGSVAEQLTQEGELRVRQRDGVGWQSISRSAATHAYLRLLRNATHSFRRTARDPFEVSLLAAHEGDVPDAVADLAFFHLLRLLAEPRLPRD
jgi:hypothetical protein